ncbi:NUDIX hydrolase [Streptomyces sp. NPDC005279]|uniref:NUDIX hydrolase n=1 Tax=Streptomyces sp. NPDC005279 TaxID=3364712 RepID=UPI00368F86B8
MIDLPITADHIRTTLTAYLDEHPEEKPGLAQILDLLDSGADLTVRSEFRGHATAGAILAGPDGRILHVHHLALDKWLLPGGHLESADDALLEAALRELTEETGIPCDAVTTVTQRPAKGEPDHQHIDFRFLFRTTADIGQLQAEEVTGAAWRDADTIGDQTLRQRIAQALR